MSFPLDPRLEADAAPIGDLALSRALLMNDARFPWVVLVPRRAGLVEISDLEPEARAALMEELARVSLALKQWPEVEKINVGALGNVVSQLHVHVVGRRAGDAAWPGPVWGSGAAAPYQPEALRARRARLARQLGSAI